ncbi:MCE family protein [Nocardia sp. NPDC127606]|uniref:MCE family protein n=1 Tax=Nocardia sp. NPDC127606 TaxID=3345406 RepID=UPI00362CECEA
MRRYENRNAARTGVVGGILILATVATVSNYDRLPVLNSDSEIRAIFADAGGLKTGDRVEFSGVNVGTVRDITLRGTDVEVTMSVRHDLALGATPSAQARTRTALGSKAVVLTPSSDDRRFDYASAIPLERTRSPYDLPTELGKLADNVAGIDTEQLSDALHTTSGVLEQSSPELEAALDGVARLSESLGSRDQALRHLFADGSKVTGVLAERSRQINTLVVDGNRILAELDARRTAIGKLSNALSAVAQQISGLIAENREQLAPTLTRLNSVLDLLERNKSSIDAALPGLVKYMGTLGESVGSGPFFSAYVGNLIPGQFIQPFVDAALGDGRVPQPEGPR